MQLKQPQTVPANPERVPANRARGVVVDGLGKRYDGRVVLDDVSFTIPEGSILALLGPNGAGKTTTVRMLATLTPIGSGRASVGGHDVKTDPAEVRRSIGLSGQEVALDRHLTGIETLDLTAALRGFPKRGRRQVVDELLERYGLAEAAKRTVGTYSGGMRRRLDLACCLVGSPDVLFLDEPTTGLDLQSRRILWDQIRAEVRRGASVLLTTQYLEEADELADRIVVLNEGTVRYQGSSADLKSAVGTAKLVLDLADADAIDRLVAEVPEGVVTSVERRDRRVELSLVSSVGAVKVAAIADRLDLAVEGVRLEEPTLDSAFLALTRREERSPSRPGEVVV
jgi:ABC-2 type transport system ATP-binding protein